jgi:hypothetical protein
VAAVSPHHPGQAAEALLLHQGQVVLAAGDSWNPKYSSENIEIFIKNEKESHHYTHTDHDRQPYICPE